MAQKIQSKQIDPQFPDNEFRIQDNADTSKQVAFEVSGITTSTTRTITLQDSDGTLAYLSDLGGGSDYVPYIQNTVAETATFTATLGETHVINTSGGSFTANLPAIASGQGRIAFYFLGTGGQLTLDPNGAETIESKSSIKISTGHNTIENDGTEWKLVQRSGRKPERLDPAQITADQNNYNPTDWGKDITHLYLDSDASRTITGIEEDGFTDMDQVIIVNDGSNDIIIAHDSASSTVANRILVDGSADFTLSANQIGVLLRDGTVNKWRLFAISAGSSGNNTPKHHQHASTSGTNAVLTAPEATFAPRSVILNGIIYPEVEGWFVVSTTTNDNDTWTWQDIGDVGEIISGDRIVLWYYT